MRRIGISLRRAGLFLLCAGRLSTADAGEIRITDDLGRIVALSSAAQRIVSLAPSLTESLFALGAGARVVGRTSYCDYPADVRHVPSVGGMTNPSIEQIVALAPDLVVVSMEGNLREDFQRLSGLGIPVYVSNPRTLDGIYRSLEHLALLSGTNAAGRRIIDSLRAREYALRHRLPDARRSVLFLISIQPLMAVGGNTLIDDLLSRAGGRNLAAPLRGHYPAVSREALLRFDPEVIFCTSEIIADPADLLRLFPEWSRIQAARNRKIIPIDADIISRPGPRVLQGLQLLITPLHGQTP